MTATSFEEFLKLYRRIPKDRLPFVSFIQLRTGTKIPLGKLSWKEQALTLKEVKSHMGYGGNIAVVGIPKGLMFLDIDLKYFTDIPEEVYKGIPDTFTVKTRSGGLHFYFLNDGKWDNQKVVYNGFEIGELRTNWQYVVSCGSWVEPATYRVINDMPISEFKGEITKLFKSGDIKDLSVKRDGRLPPTEGKIGKPITEEHKKILNRKKDDNINVEKRRKEIIEKLRRR